MKKTEFKAKDHRLPDIHTIRERPDWMDNAPAMREFLQEAETWNFLTLIEQLETYMKTPVKERENDLENKISIVRMLLAYKLGLVDEYTYDYLLDQIGESIEIVDDEVQKIDNWTSHRHKTVMGLYTEKAVY